MFSSHKHDKFFRAIKTLNLLQGKGLKTFRSTFHPQLLEKTQKTRAQALTEALWAYPESPWYHRINMLGESGLKQVSQAAWINALVATFLKSETGKSKRIGGIFGSKIGVSDTVLPWGLNQQAAFLIYAWQSLQSEFKKAGFQWMKVLRKNSNDELADEGIDLAFSGSNTLINSDQGMRAFLHVINDLLYVWLEKNNPKDFVLVNEKEEVEYNAKSITEAIKGFEISPVNDHIKNIMRCLARYDWRTSAAPELSNQERYKRLAFRGSGGYKLLRRYLLDDLAGENNEVGNSAKYIIRTLKL